MLDIDWKRNNKINKYLLRDLCSGAIKLFILNQISCKNRLRTIKDFLIILNFLKVSK